MNDNKGHRWVRHIILDVEVIEGLPDVAMGLVDPTGYVHDVMTGRTWAPINDEATLWAAPSQALDASNKMVYGCDDCGLQLTPELFDEPCLSELADQLEEGGSEDLTS